MNGIFPFLQFQHKLFIKIYNRVDSRSFVSQTAANATYHNLLLDRARIIFAVDYPSTDFKKKKIVY